MHATLTGVTQAAQIKLRYAVDARADEWAIPEDYPVPESVPHEIAAHHLLDVLRHWASRAARPLFVPYNFAIRWIEERPQVGIDPDVCVLDPPPPDVMSLKSLRLWRPGHVAPQICFEVVSETHTYKDYRDVHERYAAFGARELVVFDPLLSGPKSMGGPFSLQVWRREAGVFDRVYAGGGPVFCETLKAWLVVDGRLLQLANDSEGRDRWLTEAEQSRAEAEQSRAEAEQSRAEAEQSRAEAERLRAELAELRTKTEK